MRLGVIDVGSNTVHLLVVDAHPGARPLPASSHKIELRLTEHLDEAGDIAPAGIEALTAFVHECVEIGEDLGVEETFGFATSAVREAGNGEALLGAVREGTGVDLRVLSGRDEALATFLAVRRWFGWSAGRLLVVDIGGGSLELASGGDEAADVALSVPLGAGRLTRDLLPGDPPTLDAVRAARRYVRAEVARAVPEIGRGGTPDRVVGTSKTFRSLARICGAAHSTSGLYDERWLERGDLTGWVPKLAAMPMDRRGELPGVSQGRAPQLLAGALVAEAAMELFGVDRVQICPWALREGLILRRLDSMEVGAR